MKQYLFFRFNPDLPWLTKQSILLLAQLIKTTDTGLEFGSGRSTKWLSNRCKYLTSVEHNEEWYNVLQRSIRSQKNISLYLLSIDDTSSEASDYVRILDKIDDKSVDFILNDGRLRDIIASGTLCKLKSGGIYILDNAERYIFNTFKIPESIGYSYESMTDLWRRFYEKTITWRRIWTTDGVTSTLIMFKP